MWSGVLETRTGRPAHRRRNPTTAAKSRERQDGGKRIRLVHVVRRRIWIWLALATTASLCAIGAEPPDDPGGIELAPSPPPAATKELVHRWHRDYRRRVSPVLREWESLARAVRERPGDRLTAGCRRLELALRRLGRGRLPVAPDPSISLYLEETLRSLFEASISCTHGAYFLTVWRLEEADESWRQLRGRLLPYGLSP